MIIHLLRHGKTVANEKRLFCGNTDLPLSPGGVKGIEDLIEQGIYPSADLLFTSGLQRARQTADLIYSGALKTQITDLNEYNFGLYEMKSYDELKDQAGFKEWLADETGVIKCPQGESTQIFRQRVIKGFNTVLEEAQKSETAFRTTRTIDSNPSQLSTINSQFSTLIVCHGGVIVHIMQWLFPDKHNYPEWQPEPGRGYTIKYAPEEIHTYHKI